MLTTFKTQLVEKEVELNKVKAGLIVSEQELKNTPQVIVTKKSVGQDPLFNQIVAETSDTSMKDVAQTFDKYNLFVAPVINDQEILEGIITVDDVFSIVIEELWGERSSIS